ncbi:coiled-coil domain-containing protein 81-like isoform X1 [Rhea pennata]|uniref:coiled-coil domain-containing protein 81-like isoform X1 n=2 Tax=Rhea pennata TaxID=8795 RepID=UPI002E257276
MEGCWTETISPDQKSLFPTLLQLSAKEIIAIWDAVSNYILEEMMRDKGVLLEGLGTFGTVREPLRLGKSDVLMVRRPVFQLGMDMVWLQEPQRPKVTLPDTIKVKPLNYRHLSRATSFSRRVVEDCVEETIRLFSSHVRNKEKVAFAFRDIGLLTCQKDQVRMRFYPHCTQRLEGTASLAAAHCSKRQMTHLSISGRPAALGSRPSPVHVFPRFQLSVQGSPEAHAAPAGSPPEEELEEELAGVRSSKGQGKAAFRPEQRPGKLLQHREELSLPMLPTWGEGRQRQGLESKPAARSPRKQTAPILGTTLQKEAALKYLPHPPAGPRSRCAPATPTGAAQHAACPATQSFGTAAHGSLSKDKQRQHQALREEQQLSALEKRARRQAQIPLLEKQFDLEQRRCADTDVLGRPPQRLVSPQALQNMQLMTSYKVLRDRWKERVEQNRQWLRKEEEERRASVMSRLRSREQQDRALGAYHQNGFYAWK